MGLSRHLLHGMLPPPWLVSKFQARKRKTGVQRKPHCLCSPDTLNHTYQLIVQLSSHPSSKIPAKDQPQKGTEAHSSLFCAQAHCTYALLEFTVMGLTVCTTTTTWQGILSCLTISGSHLETELTALVNSPVDHF